MTKSSGAAQWFKGDFHAHTLRSDGVLTPTELVEHAKRQDLDFFAITDHNTWTYPDVAEADRHGDVAIIPGVEVTMPFGHFNAFAEATAEPDWMGRLVADSFETVGDIEPGSSLDLMKEVMQSGFRASICHPLLAPWNWTDGEVDLLTLDYVEVWNSPTWPENLLANPAAVDLWTKWLNAGIRTAAIGGSDFHNPALVERSDGALVDGDVIGEPATYVFAESTATVDLLTALDHRRAYVSMGPTFTLVGAGNDGDVGIGDVAGPTDALALEVVVQSDVAIDVELVLDGSRSTIASGSGQIGWEGSVPLIDGWVRVDVRAAGQLVLVSNPVFALDVASESIAFGALT